MTETDLYAPVEGVGQLHSRLHSGEKREGGGATTHEVSPFGAQATCRLDGLADPKMTRKRFDPQAIDNERLQPRLVLVLVHIPMPICVSVPVPVHHQRRQRRQSDIMGHAVINFGRDVAHVREVGELAIEQEPEAVERGRRFGEVLAVVDCRARPYKRPSTSTLLHRRFFEHARTG